jgi:hypothetical protein
MFLSRDRAVALELKKETVNDTILSSAPPALRAAVSMMFYRLNESGPFKGPSPGTYSVGQSFA